MMDLAMIVTLFICFGIIKLFTDWCDSQIQSNDEKKK